MNVLFSPFYMMNKYFPIKVKKACFSQQSNSSFLHWSKTPSNFPQYPRNIQKEHFMEKEKALILHMWKNHSEEKKLFSIEELKQACQSSGYATTTDKLKKMLSSQQFRNIFCVIKCNKNRIYANLTKSGQEEARSLIDKLNIFCEKKPNYLMKQEEMLLLHMWKNHSEEKKLFSIEELKQACQASGYATTTDKLKKMLSSQQFRNIFCVIKRNKDRIYVNLTKSGQEEADALALNTLDQEENSRCLKIIPKGHHDCNNSIYRSSCLKTNQVQYIGRTNDFKKRRKEHFRRNGMIIHQIPELVNLRLKEARVIEQSLIDLYFLEKNGGSLKNAINSIKPTKKLYGGPRRQDQNLQKLS